MTGYEDFNRAAFREAREYLRDRGYHPVCPEELDTLDPAKGRQWADYMQRDIPYLTQVDGGVALPGWQDSRGALLEACILNALGKPVYSWPHRFNKYAGILQLSLIDPADLPEAVLPGRSIALKHTSLSNT